MGLTATAICTNSKVSANQKISKSKFISPCKSYDINKFTDEHVQKEYAKVYGSNSSKTNQTGKNILLITSDQHHWICMGYNNKKLKTPNLDRLAKMGTIFDRAYTTNPTCTPMRATIITGQYPSQHGAYALGTKLMENVHTVGEDFQKAGYKTALVGKAHFQPLKGNAKYPSVEAYPILQDLDFWKNFNGPFYGFERVELARNHTDEAHVGQHYVIWMEEKLKKQGKDPKEWRKWFTKPTGLCDAQYGSWNISEEFHYDVWIAEKTNELIEEYYEEGKNFFVWASFFDPHPSYLVCDLWASMYKPEEMEVPKKAEGEHDDMPPQYKWTQLVAKEAKKKFSEYEEEGGNICHGFHSHTGRTENEKAKDMAIYFGMISMMDHYIGKILNKLDELNLTQKTLIVFTTDHGHFYGQHGLIAKGSFGYEDGVKLPFIAALPGKIPSGKRNSSMQSLVDLAPTFLSISGIEIPSCMTGLDQKQVWFGQKESVHDHVIVENRHQPTKIVMKTYIDKRYKMTIYCDKEYGELFDLEKDPRELENLWDNSEYKGLRFRLLLKFMHAEVGKEPVLMPRIACA